MKIINHFREYKQEHTDGELYIPTQSARFCHVLEDIGRPHGVKIDAETCIPEGIYSVIINKSHRFNKDMILLFNQEDKSIYRFGVSFTGVRAHGGNNIHNSEGCPLIAYNSDLNGKIWGRASDDLLLIIQDWIDSGETVKWVISS